MDERAGLGRGKRRRAAHLRLEAILIKERTRAGEELIHARGGQIELFAVQALDGVRSVQRTARAALSCSREHPLVILIKGIGRRDRRCAVAREIRARKLDRRPLRLQTVAHGLGPMGRERHVRQQAAHRADKVARPRFAAARVACVPREQQLLARARERTVQRFLLHEQALLARGLELHAERVQPVALHIAEQRRRGGILRDQTIVHAEQDHIFYIAAADALDVAAADAVERDRDAADRIAAEHEAEQLREAVERQRHIAAHPRELLHRGDKDLPQLPVLVRELQTARRIVLGGALLHAARRVHREQEII